MKKLFDETSFAISKLLTNKYTTSFSIGALLIHGSMRPKTYAIYGFVRLADEIVDSFEGYPQEELLSRFIDDYQDALKKRISTNPILNSFQEVANEYELNAFVEQFLNSMKMDIDTNNYTAVSDYERYIHGSAEVVGLMCLKIFVEKDPVLFEELKPYAIKLGSAFQKINFLRDLKDDMKRLGRSYFPNVDWENFTEKEKKIIMKEINEDFALGLVGIKKLSHKSRLGVYVAYRYYLKLMKKIARISPEKTFTKRIRVSNFQKVIIFAKSFVRYHLNIL